MAILDKTGGKLWSETNFDILDNVIDSGSNPNGTYIKFSDGTQICYNQNLLSANNNANGQAFTLPANFSSIDFSINASAIGVASNGLGASYVVEAFRAEVSMIRVKITVHAPTAITAPPDGTVKFGYIAVGRWK